MASRRAKPAEIQASGPDSVGMVEQVERGKAWKGKVSRLLWRRDTPPSRDQFGNEQGGPAYVMERQHASPLLGGDYYLFWYSPKTVRFGHEGKWLPGAPPARPIWLFPRSTEQHLDEDELRAIGVAGYQVMLAMWAHLQVLNTPKRGRPRRVRENPARTRAGAPGPFRLAAFARLATPGGRIAYADARLAPMGAGSGRVVYVLSSRKALKVARDAGGVAQNRVEQAAAQDLAAREAVTRVYDAAPDGAWLVAELVRPVTGREELYARTGTTAPLLAEVVARVGTQGAIAEVLDELALYGDISAAQLKAYRASRLLPALVHLARRHRLNPDDFGYEEHYGVTSDGRVVLLDYGWTG